MKITYAAKEISPSKKHNKSRLFSLRCVSACLVKWSAVSNKHELALPLKEHDEL